MAYSAAETCRTQCLNTPIIVFRLLLHVVILYEYDDSPHATTYLSIENEDLCKAWLTAQLRCAGHNV